MEIMKSLMAQAKELRAVLESPERDALAGEVARIKEQYHAACGHVGNPRPEAAELRERLEGYQLRLQRITDQRNDATARLAELDKQIHCEERAKSAAAELRKARAKVASIEGERDKIAQTIERMEAMQADERAAAAAARASIAGEVVASLSDDVRAFIGDAAQADKGNQPQHPPEWHDQRAQAIGEAIERAQAQLAQLDQELGTARDAEQQASDELLAQNAYRAEVAHAEALAAYLPALARYRGCHLAAFGWAPSLPDLERLADEGFDQAVADAREAVNREAGEGLVRRGLRKLLAS